jgi:hypothetical protein
MAFEQVDRRLIARNNWRNTTNTFQGARAVIGSPQGPAQLDAFALQPLQRLEYTLDEVISDQWFVGAVATIRRWSQVATFQPYYLLLRQAAAVPEQRRAIHSPALRGYGVVPDTNLDFDLHVMVQRGTHLGRAHRAWGLVAELGYTLDAPRKRRLSANYSHATGERPGDTQHERFERMFGFARPFSNNLYFTWENLRAIKTRIELGVASWLDVDFGASAYWLDSATDRWRSPGLIDPTGASGRLLGHEADIQARVKPHRQIDLNSGYALFLPGEFPERFGRGAHTHFLYLELLLRAF